MAQYFVYIIECADHSLYTGIATDVTRRFKEHQTGRGARFTRAKKARRLVYQEPHSDRSSALKREAAIKRFSRVQKLSLIKESKT